MDSDFPPLRCISYQTLVFKATSAKNNMYLKAPPTSDRDVFLQALGPISLVPQCDNRYSRLYQRPSPEVGRKICTVFAAQFAIWRNNVLKPQHIDEFVQRIQRFLPSGPDGADSLQEEFRESARQAFSAIIAKMDLVTREEFEVQSELLERAYERLEALEAAATPDQIPPVVPKPR
ncbi:MAG: BMFP domain-containing protein YqiC [Gammaproteobacteria bacterium]